MYCVSIVPSGGLLPGEWTHPGGESVVTIEFADTSQVFAERLFGWDYELLPEPVVANPTDCTDQALFVEDVTIPDNTELAAGDAFEKTWRFQNIGTCTWTPEYHLAFEKGEKMGAGDRVAFVTNVPPQGTVDLTVNLSAPSTIGTYQGKWQLLNADGERIPIGKSGKGEFWVQIVVAEKTGNLDLGAPDWTDTFNSAANWFLLNNSNTKFEVKDGQLVMTRLTAGGNEEWGLSNQPALTDFYVQGKFTTGDACASADRYGMLLRAPEPNAGYVLGISCGGSYRLYKWDGAYTPLQEWKPSPSIKSGAKQTNLVGFWAKGSTLKIYINGNLIAEFTDTKFSKGQFGLLIGAPDTKNFTVYVDEISYWKLDD